MTAKAKTGTLTASGDAFAAMTTAAGSDGGSVVVEAADDVTLDSARLSARAISIAGGAVGDGGTIAVRSYSADLSWQNGEGDVRPVATGVITLTACGTITTTGTNFNGEVPSQANNCAPTMPSLPSYVGDFFDSAERWDKCLDQATKSGVKFHDLNGDGIKDAGEPGLEDWTINAYADDGAGTPANANNDQLDGAEYAAGPGRAPTTTDANGSLQPHPAPPATTSSARSCRPAGPKALPPTASPNAASPPPTPTSATRATRSPSPPASRTPTTTSATSKHATKSGTKFNDLNGNGVQDAGEPGLEDWVINAYADDGAGTPANANNDELDGAEYAAGPAAHRHHRRQRRLHPHPAPRRLHRLRGAAGRLDPERSLRWHRPNAASPPPTPTSAPRATRSPSPPASTTPATTSATSKTRPSRGSSSTT